MSRRSKRNKRVNEEIEPIEEKETKKISLSSKLAKLDKKKDFSSSEDASDDQKKDVIKYWLMKSEPESRIENGHEMKFSFDDLKTAKDQITWWDGVRNYEARNHMKSMKIGDRAFFYHSNCKNPGIIGVVKVCKEAYVDHTAFDSKDAHYDPKSDKNNPKWFMVSIQI